MRDQLREVLAGYEPQGIEKDDSLWPAAVLVLVYEHHGRHHVVFQKRTDRVDAHKGQISFPGGGQDPEDEGDLVRTAVRETHEEIGVHPDHIEILGRLDDIKTISNFAVTPYVGWLSHYPYEWTFSDEEVAYLLEVPVDHLRHPGSYVPDRRVVNGVQREMPAYQWQDDLIWGATARMLTNFLDLWRVAAGE